MRGLAIIGIFLHNYCHWLGFAVKENEYTFTMSKASDLMQALAQPDLNLPIHLVSFFGHYGVPVFLFLSAYGLVMKYEKRGALSPKQTNVVPFLKHHYVKLFKMMIVGFVAFTMVDAITPGSHKYHVMDILGQMFMFNNMMPDPDHVIWPGPYWFFGLMMQLYIVYRLLLWRKGDVYALLLIAVCWAMQAFCDPEGDMLNRVRYNFMGGVLPFCAGLLYARHGKQLTHGVRMTLMVISVVAVFFFSFNFQTWLWAPLFVCTASIGIVKLLPKTVNEWIAWVGTISAALFVLHPLTRKIFIPISRHGDVYTGLLLYIVASIALAWFYHNFKLRNEDNNHSVRKHIAIPRRTDGSRNALRHSVPCGARPRRPVLRTAPLRQRGG